MVGSLEYLLITSIWVPPYLALKPMVTIPHFHYWVSHYIPIKWLLNANFSPLFSHGFHGSSIFPWYSHSYSITYSHDIPVDGWEILRHQAWMLFQHKSWDVYHQLVQDFAGPSTVIIIVYIYIYYIIIYHIPMIFHIIPILSIHDTFSTEISPFPVGTTGFQRQYRFMSWSLMAVTSWVQLASWRHGMGRMIYRSIYLYIYICICIYVHICYIYICIHVCTYQSFGSIDWMMYT